MSSRVMRFDLNCQDIKIKEILNNKDFIKVEIWAISDAYPNNNKSHFPLDSMETNVNEGNFYNKPILGRWNYKNGDYEVHNSTVKYDPEYDNTYFDYEDGETPIGVIRSTDEVKIVKKDGLNWIVFTAVLWVKYGYQGIKKILKSRKKKVSVEVSVFDSFVDENDIEVFKKWSFDGVTILGNLPNTTIPAHEGIENAHLTILEKLQEGMFSNKVRALQFAYQELDREENNVIKEDNSSFNINNEEKEDKALALTYEQKRTLLEMFLSNNVKKDNEDCWTWVADLTDDLCYYCVCGEYYQATYSIVEAEVEGEEPVVTINIEEARKVVRDWKTFEEDVEGCDTQDESSENFDNGSQGEEKPDEDKPNEESEKKENSEEDNQEQTVSKETEIDDQKSEDDSENKNDQETECGNMSEDQEKDDQDDEQCKMDKDDDSENNNDDSDDVQDDDNCTCVLSFNDIEHAVSKEVFDYFNSIISEKSSLSNNLNDVIAERDDLNKQLLEMTSNFEAANNENIELKKQITEAQNLELSKKAYSIAIEQGFSEDESKAFEKDCLNGKYSDEATVTKEIIYQSFLKKQEEKDSSEQKDFSAKIPDNVKEKKSNKDNSSSVSNLKDFVNEK